MHLRQRGHKNERSTLMEHLSRERRWRKKWSHEEMWRRKALTLCVRNVRERGHQRKSQIEGRQWLKSLSSHAANHFCSRVSLLWFLCFWVCNAMQCFVRFIIHFVLYLSRLNNFIISLYPRPASLILSITYFS